MFNFINKYLLQKSWEPKNLKNFSDIINNINFYINSREFIKAKEYIDEVKEKEKEIFTNFIKNPELDQKVIKKAQKIYDLKIKKLEKIENKYKKVKKKYDEELEKKETEIRIKKIDNKIWQLIWRKKINLAEWLLNNFLENYKENLEIIKYYNKKKKQIIKLKKKYKNLEESKLKNNSKLEAMKLIWKLKKVEEEKEEQKKKNIFDKIKEKINILKVIEEKIKERKLLDEITILLEEDKNITEDNLKAKLWKLHRWMIRELINNELVWYRFFWKTMWADKITWDVFEFDNLKKKYVFYIWDATGHWIRSGFTITYLKEAYRKFVWKYTLKELVLRINNYLKEKLKSWNFVTSIFFEIDKNNYSEIKFVWAWHEPMLLYKHEIWEVQKIIPWWLAAWIRKINDTSKIKEQILKMDNEDILLLYTDWIVEARNSQWEMFWLDRVAEKFRIISEAWKDFNEIYEYLIQSVENFTWSSRFEDDMTLVFIKREFKKDKVEKEEVKNILKHTKIPESYAKKLIWKTKEEIEKELEKIKHKEQINAIVRNLEQLYETREILKLKEEAIRYIKEWFIDKRINDFLKKAMKQEFDYKIWQKNRKLESKYNTLKILLDKWEYETVIEEVADIISKDWNI